MRWSAIRAVILGVLLACACAAPAAAQLFDPAYRFQVLSTDHFRIYFHQGEERLASRLAAIAEDTWHRLDAPLAGRTRLPARTHVVLVDQTDLANGWATPLPRDTIAIYAVWPAGSDELKTDDWLRLAMTHEFTHIVHLDRSEGWARGVRWILGRHPIAFPNVFLPPWQVEGLAVYEESVITGEGRMHAGDFRAIVDEAARARRLLPLDRVNGGLTRWPNGRAPYAYGLSFHAFLADRYGANTLADLADQTSRGVPFFGSLAFRRVFGKSLGTLWKEFETDAASHVQPTAAAGTPPPERLTHHRYEVIGPRVVPATCAGCAADIYYSVRTPDNLPAVYRLRSGTSPERVITRIDGSTMAPWHDRVYFDQQEIRRNVGAYSDLYSLDLRTRAVRRLTHDGRYIDPDVSADGRLVAVRIAPGRRDLVLFEVSAAADRLGAPSVLVQEEATQFNAPRWSPDGRAIVVERQRLGASSEIVIVDPVSRTTRVVAAAPGTRWATPTWRPDGAAIVAAAAIGETPFHLFEIVVATGATRQLTFSSGGETWPEVLPDGKSIVYVGYTVEGFELFRLAYPAMSSAPVAGATPVLAREPAPTTGGETVPQLRGSSARPYAAIETVFPTWWSPILDSTDNQAVFGASTSGGDVLGYHSYAATLTWRNGTLNGAPKPKTPADWDVTYAYTRWRAPVFVSTSKSTSFFAASPRTGTPAFTREQRTFEAGVEFPVIHVRARQTALASFITGVNDFTVDRDVVSRTRAAARFGWSFTTAHEFPNAISAERGLAVGATTELVRSALGAEADATTVAADARAYLPGLLQHHVIALRGASGLTRGDDTVGRVFTLGGDANPGVIDFSSDAFRLLRGFGANTFVGTRIVAGSAEYRFPLLRPERGIGTFPLFLHTVHASVFADAGNVWTTEFAGNDVKTSLGAEIAAKMMLGFYVPLDVAVGAAKGHDGSGAVGDRTRVYVRVGAAF